MWVLVAVIGLGVAAAIYFVYDAQQDDDGPATTTSVGDPGISLPQDPSLELRLEDGVWYVENDGNVTMSEVEVRDDDDAVVCEIGTLAPADRKPCEGADEGQEGLVAAGQGPQGQPVEVSAS